MKKIEIPNSCGNCKYGRTRDLSVDDLCTTCFITGIECDWMDFPRNSDRMYGCPLPNVSESKLRHAEKIYNLYTTYNKVWNRMLNAKGKEKKKYVSRLNKIGKKIHQVTNKIK